MKRFIATALIIGVSTFGLVGCDEKSKVEDKETVKTPNGSSTTTTTEEQKKTGDLKDSEKDKGTTTEANPK